MDYDFKVGDEVITVAGIRGTIVSICDCANCKSRGFLEPFWQQENGDTDYITKYDAEHGFDDFYRIGKYRFSEFDRDWITRSINREKKIIANLEARLKLMDEIEKQEEPND